MNSLKEPWNTLNGWRQSTVFFFQDYWVVIAMISVFLAFSITALTVIPDSTGIETITIDGCEYLRDTRHAVPVVHKANCKNH